MTGRHCFRRGIVLASLMLSVLMAQAQRQSTFGIGVKASLLGAGVEVAKAMSPRFNLRAGFNYFDYNRDLDKDGVRYAGNLTFQSIETRLDWFPFGGAFHLSPGVLVYNGTQVKADAMVAGGQTFTLNDVDYVSDAANPVHGTGKIEFLKAAPMVTVGWGNLVPRNGRRWSIPFELGVVFQGAPHMSLNLNGGACDATGVNCRSILSDPTVATNVNAERDRINREMSAFKVYPVMSIGFAFNF